jgi:hypothetical protein
MTSSRPDFRASQVVDVVKVDVGHAKVEHVDQLVGQDLGSMLLKIVPEILSQLFSIFFS